MTHEQILLLCTFGAVALLAWALMRLMIRPANARMEQRLQRSIAVAAPAGGAGASVSIMLDRVGRTVGKPFQPTSEKDQSALRQKLGEAGFYSASAAHLFAGTRAIALAAGLLAGYFLIGRLIPLPLVALVLGAAIGYLIPTVILGILVSRRHKQLDHALPDALDLMVVCVEAGLTLDAATQRVGREIHLAHPALAKELAIAHLEAQMGVPRAQALRNLGRRTGAGALQSLAAMLVQAERFGTGIGQALKVHAESLRIKRQYAAEEMAAKATVKIVFPLVLCIFPAMLIVIGGPAVIRMYQAGFLGK